MEHPVRIQLVIKGLIVNNVQLGDVTIEEDQLLSKEQIKTLKLLWLTCDFLSDYIVGYTSSEEATLDFIPIPVEKA